MTGAVTGIADPGWVPPVDFVMEMADSTSPAAIYAHTIWTQLKDCIVFAAGDTFAAGSSGGRAKVTLTTAEVPARVERIPIRLQVLTAAGTISTAAPLIRRVVPP